jgi:hypothetical protein
MASILSVRMFVNTAVQKMKVVNGKAGSVRMLPLVVRPYWWKVNLGEECLL